MNTLYSKLVINLFIILISSDLVNFILGDFVYPNFDETTGLVFVGDTGTSDCIKNYQPHMYGDVHGLADKKKDGDSSVERGVPFYFNLGQGQVIQGWDEGITYFNKGAKGTIYLPSKLGYGSRGAGGVIPPNAILIFDIELISF